MNDLAAPRTTPFGNPVTRYDVAVLGAGPAGTAAARAAATTGARVVVVERARLPRYKTCGGGIVGLSADAAGIDLAPLTRAVVGRVTVTHQGRVPITRGVFCGRPLLSMVMRAELDLALLHAAEAAGAQVRSGAVVTGLKDADGAVTLIVRDGLPVRARVVVGADGSAGRAGGHVGVRCDLVDLGLEGEFLLRGAAAAQWQGRLLLDWGPVPGSYAWVFPKGDLLSVGVIGAREHAGALRAYYREVVDRVGLSDVDPVTESGHLTRVRRPGSPLRRGRVLVAGDAAGLLEPWTREGISYALRSGRLAGAAAGRAAAGDLHALADYPRQVEQVLGAEMAAGREVLSVYRRHPGIFHGTLGLLPGGFGLFARLVDGRSSLAGQLRRPGARLALTALSVC